MAALRQVLTKWSPFLTRQTRVRTFAAAGPEVVDDLSKPEPPNGFLFNEKPLLPGEKRQKEDWENIWVYGMGFNMLLFLAVCIWKPDTSLSKWGRARAVERLQEEEGEEMS